jgi:hypothetical protein
MAGGGVDTVMAASHMYFDVVEFRLLTHWMKLYRSNGSTADGDAFDKLAATLDVFDTRSVSWWRDADARSATVWATGWRMYGSKGAKTSILAWVSALSYVASSGAPHNAAWGCVYGCTFCTGVWYGDGFRMYAGPFQ